ncbi:hypothetical protein SISNIDRAFT_444548 [Sistotremastrum niveocremeum HHB9708]|uniref:PIN domain-containing protein n=1 Tax=Sistotremastrum niveocremeum HHB9708 TaxID=1314777 RepID=A0A164QQP1_9AGAM|nr:hypothetical protein SISNIDRAFT_444548 [Sistotremastrum niveocremeum HHB9708]
MDLAERMVAFQRRNAACVFSVVSPYSSHLMSWPCSASRPRERAERPPSARKQAPPAASTSLVNTSSQSPRQAQPSVPQVLVDAPDEPDEYRRRHPASSSSRPPHSSGRAGAGKLYNPDLDALPSRRMTAEPEVMSEASSSGHDGRHDHAYVRSKPTAQREAQSSTAARQLFDPRKHDPVKFNNNSLIRPMPTPKSSADTFVSASSTSVSSSYARSIGSSFTLTSNSTGTSSFLSGIQQRKEDGEGNNAFLVQLKRLYREISALEAKLLSEDADDEQEDSVRSLKSRAQPSQSQNEDKWPKLIVEHKSLAEMMHNLMTLTLSPQVPTSVNSISTKYNIPTRLWGNVFHRLLESLRRAALKSPVALEHLTEFIYYAYSFYSALLEEHQLSSFRNGWLEALGDLASYRMAVVAITPPAESLNILSISRRLPTPPPEPRIDDSPSPSVGAHAAMALEVDSDKEIWRGTARRWYSAGLQETPGYGKLHHHLGLLSRESEAETLRAVYHFTKSMTTLRPFPTSRESILPLFSIEAQLKRSSPDATTTELFVLLQGMLFTNIQMDDFPPTLSRFLESLSFDTTTSPNAVAIHTAPQLEERDWIMMAVVNIASILEYGKEGGVLKRIAGSGPRENGGKGPDADTKILSKRGDGMHGRTESVLKKMEVDEPEEMHEDEMHEYDRFSDDHDASQPSDEAPQAFQRSVQLVFAILSHTMRHPVRKPTPWARSTLNPYITVLLTWLAYAFKRPQMCAMLERWVPWDDFVHFLNSIPFPVLASEVDGGARLTQGTMPLPEDWCCRGMEWAARGTFERGFWKCESGVYAELEVLNREEVTAINATDGIIEDDDDDEGERKREKGDTSKRWARIVRASASISRAVDGFRWNNSTRKWEVTGKLAEKVAHWKEEDRLAKEEDERRRRGRRWDSDEEMDVEEDEQSSDEESEELSDDPEEIKALKARRRHLRNLLSESNRQSSKRPVRHVSRGRPHPVSRPPLHVIPGYTVLVVDTNILLGSLSSFAALVESERWTVIVPLAVITELDGLSANNNQLGVAAAESIAYISSHARTHSVSLKIQTSQGNYLHTLGVRSEDVQFDSDESSWERNMDDLILRAAVWQDDHWVDRSNLLKSEKRSSETESAAKVVLLSFDRNLRLKARARELAAADQRDLASILVVGT